MSIVVQLNGADFTESGQLKVFSELAPPAPPDAATPFRIIAINDVNGNSSTLDIDIDENGTLSSGTIYQPSSSFNNCVIQQITCSGEGSGKESLVTLFFDDDGTNTTPANNAQIINQQDILGFANSPVSISYSFNPDGSNGIRVQSSRLDNGQRFIRAFIVGYLET